MSNKDSPDNGKLYPLNKLGHTIKKNAFTLLLALGVLIMLLSPDAKSWVLRQLLNTGIFNANMAKKTSTTEPQSELHFNYSTENGSIENTASLQGKVVFINFWASWCPPCKAELPSIANFYSRYKDNANIAVLIINVDEDLAIPRAYLKKNGLAIPIYRIHGQISNAIYSGTLPTTVVLAKNGQIHYKHEGFAKYDSQKFIDQLEAMIKE